MKKDFLNEMKRYSVFILKLFVRWMNMACDLRDLELMYNTTLDISPNRPSLSMALLKLLPNDSSQFLLAHASSSL